jgi:hypothetical protein
MDDLTWSHVVDAVSDVKTLLALRIVSRALNVFATSRLCVVIHAFAHRNKPLQLTAHCKEEDINTLYSSIPRAIYVTTPFRSVENQLLKFYNMYYFREKRLITWNGQLLEKFFYMLADTRYRHRNVYYEWDTTNVRVVPRYVFNAIHHYFEHNSSIKSLKFFVMFTSGDVSMDHCMSVLDAYRCTLLRCNLKAEACVWRFTKHSGFRMIITGIVDGARAGCH